MKLKNTILAAVAAASAFGASISYAADSEPKDEYIKIFGMMMFERNGLSELQLTPAEFDQFVAGMKDSLAGKKVPSNIQEIGEKMFKYLNSRAEANVAKEAEKVAAKMADFWKELEKKDGINKTPTGLAYEIIEKGNGATPNENSDVVVAYKGTLTDGTVFDQSPAGKPAQFNLSKVIPGFREGLQKIGKGGKAKLYIPSKLGYGNKPIPGIPGNSTLVFEVELVDVPATAPAPAPAAAPKSDKQ